MDSSQTIDDFIATGSEQGELEQFDTQEYTRNSAKDTRMSDDENELNDKENDVSSKGNRRSSRKIIKIDIEEIKRLQKFVRVEGRTAYIDEPEEILQEWAKKKIIYKTVSAKTKRVRHMPKKTVEKCLQPIWGDFDSLMRGKDYGTVNVLFASEEEAKAHSTRILETNELLLLPTYMGKCTTIVKVERIPPQVEVLGIKATILYDLVDSVSILKTTHLPLRNRLGQGLEMIVQATDEELESMPNTVEVSGDRDLRVMIYGRKPRCYKCGQTGHMKSSCTSVTPKGSPPLPDLRPK